MDNIDRLLDAMEHPDNYNPIEIEAMLQDPVVKEVFDLFDKTKSSLLTIETPDIAEEWMKFENNHRRPKNSHIHWLPRFFTRNAAASIVVCIASVAAVAAIVGVGIHRISNVPSETTPEVKYAPATDIATSKPDITDSDEQNDRKSPETIVFDNETFESIITRIGSYYEYTVIFNSEAVKSLRLYFRWNQALSIEEIVESLNNFEQINLTLSGKTIKID